MTTLPTSPFPELRPLEESRQVPSLTDLLSGGSSLPIDTSPPEAPAQPTPSPTRRTPLRVTRFPAAEERTPPRRITPGILAEMPVGPREEPPLPASIAEYMATPLGPESLEAHPTPQPGSTPAKQFPTPTPATPSPLPTASTASTAAPKPASRRAPADLGPLPSPTAASASASAPHPAAPLRSSQRSVAPKQATDEDLENALLPILEETLSKALYAPETGLHTYLEPMLRSTVRRAIAEQMETSNQFRSIGAADRLAWRLSALFTSRSYDEIVFDRTRRYQVEEAFLLRKESHSLLSYASHDPVRHASQRRIESTLKTLVSKLLDTDGKVQLSFDLPDRRVALVRTGSHSLLVAVLRGSSNALVRADLDYVQRQVEERFGNRLDEETDAFIHVLQPILEGCLLIQSPAPPR